MSARAFVGWYNGLPEYASLPVAARLAASEDAVVIGQGNVAMDVARILLSPLSALRHTDITEAAVAALHQSRVKRVRVVGRRGPLQASYTIKEARELMQLPDVSFGGVDPALFLTHNLKQLPRQLMRTAQVLQKGSPVDPAHSNKAWELRYLLSPVSFEPAQPASPLLGAVAFHEMQYALDNNDLSTLDFTDMNLLRSLRVRPVEPPTLHTLKTGLAFRSVGYKSTPLAGFDALQTPIPFDTTLGILPNDRHGRVLSPSLGPGSLAAGHIPGAYCAGWVKRGPTGVIASTMEDAFNTAEVIVADWRDRVAFMDEGRDGDGGRGLRHGWDAVQRVTKERGIRTVAWEEWEIISREEERRGREKGKLREKCTSVDDMLKILDG